MEVIRRNRSYVDTDQDVVIVVGIAKVSDVPGGPGRVENHVLEHYDNGTYTNSWENLVKSTSSLFWWVASVRVGTCQGMSVEIVVRDKGGHPCHQQSSHKDKLEHLYMVSILTCCL